MDFIAIITESGRSAIELSLFSILPIILVMVSLTSLLEILGVINMIVKGVSPLSAIIGITGISFLALLQLSFISLAAAVATVMVMERSRVSDRHLAATLAMMFALGQANLIYPLATIGLDFWIALLISIIGGLSAAAFTYHLLGRKLSTAEGEPDIDAIAPGRKQNILETLNQGGVDAFRICIGMMPVLALSLFTIAVLKKSGFFELSLAILSPALSVVGIDPVYVIPTIVKVLGGGTAALAILNDLHLTSAVTDQMINSSAGWFVNTFDLPGVAMLIASPRLFSLWKLAAVGAVVGILIRVVCHSLIF